MQKNYLCGGLIKQIHDELEKKASTAALIGSLLTCIPGAVMHFTCTSML